MFTSVLTSVEFEAHSRNLNYFQYMQLHSELNIQSALVSEELFYALCAAFDDCEI